MGAGAGRGLYPRVRGSTHPEANGHGLDAGGAYAKIQASAWQRVDALLGPSVPYG